MHLYSKDPNILTEIETFSVRKYKFNNQSYFDSVIFFYVEIINFIIQFIIIVIISIIYIYLISLDKKKTN